MLFSFYASLIESAARRMVLHELARAPVAHQNIETGATFVPFSFELYAPNI
jgi:hypothetical protein